MFWGKFKKLGRISFRDMKNYIFTVSASSMVGKISQFVKKVSNSGLNSISAPRLCLGFGKFQSLVWLFSHMGILFPLWKTEKLLRTTVAHHDLHGSRRSDQAAKKGSKTSKSNPILVDLIIRFLFFIFVRRIYLFELKTQYWWPRLWRREGDNDTVDSDRLPSVPSTFWVRFR